MRETFLKPSDSAAKEITRTQNSSSAQSVLKAPMKTEQAQKTVPIQSPIAVSAETIPPSSIIAPGFGNNGKMKEIPQLHLDASVPGPMAYANVLAGNKLYKMSPNQVGGFDRIYLQPLQRVSITAQYPTGGAGDKILIEVEDGGKLDNQTVVENSELDSQRTITFGFTTSGQNGIHQVTLRNGTDIKTLDFYVGKELPIALK